MIHTIYMLTYIIFILTFHRVVLLVYLIESILLATFAFSTVSYLRTTTQTTN